MKKIVLLALLCGPLAVMAATFTPNDVKTIYYVKNNNDYEVHMFLKTGAFYKFDSVQYQDSRYLLLEDTARQINDHRKFTGFDDDDLVYLVQGTVPYTNNDIKSVDVEFTESTVAIDAKFFTGGGFTINEDYNRKFLTREEVADYVVGLINKQDGFEGVYKIAQILEQYEEFENIEYYAPDVRSIQISFDAAEQTYVADVVFENEAIKKYAIFPKDTRRKIVVDVAARINEFYDDFEEEGSITPDLVEQITTWKDIPTLIDEIESITVQRKDDETVYVMVVIPIDAESASEVLLETAFKDDFTQREELTIAIAELFDKSENFGDEFDLLTLDELTLIGDIDVTKFEFSSEQSTAIETFDENDSQETEMQTEEDTESETDEVETTEVKPTGTKNTEQEALLAQIIAIIIQIIAESGIDIDISALTDSE